ncbi:hypothetical protein J4232_04275 [Candidatus Woesearchaeota archaeon]|nr:hypothetical protein [Candidatus Woesearchaeota archaeon]
MSEGSPEGTELLTKFGFKEEEEIELGRDNAGQYITGKTGYPKPLKRYRTIYQVFNQSIEETYFWLLEHLRHDQGFHDIIKITDTFTASEHSAFFGSAQQRIGLQQDKVSQFLATIGKMIKELFQLVRELRILDERLQYYNDSYTESKSRESAEITLKGIWIDLVEQGSKNPASVYGMARELQFTTLPDLFFSIHPREPEDVDEMINALDFNKKVKEVLKRKLRTYLDWKKATFNELKNRRIFTIKYLRQHFEIIKMYLSWVKPYLRNIRRLELSDKTKSPDLIAAFEGSIIEIEILCQKFPVELTINRMERRNKKIKAVVILTIMYRSKPTLSYQQEYQRGPIHVGLTDITLRTYAWEDKNIQNYIKMREKEDLELLKSVDSSVKAAMEALGDELERYLKEAGDETAFEKKKDDHHEKKKKSFIESILGTFISFKSASSHGKHDGHGKGGRGHDEIKLSEPMLETEKDTAKRVAGDAIWQTYKNYKKKEKLLNW